MSRIIQVYDEEKQSNVQVRNTQPWRVGSAALATETLSFNPLVLILSTPLSLIPLDLSILPSPSLPFSSIPSLLLLLFSVSQADSEVAEAGKAVSLYFEEKLAEIYPDQSFPVEAEKRPQAEDEEEQPAEDSDDDFVQPKRKRLKTDEKLFHIKWRGSCRK